MGNDKSIIMEQLHFFEELIPQIDAIYARLALCLKKMSPILRKRNFNTDDQARLKDFLHSVHHELEDYDQLIRRGEGQRDFIRSEILRQKSQTSNIEEEYTIAEGELWSLEQSLLIREKGLLHLNELIQLLDSVYRVGEMTEFDERLLTEIVVDLKNLAG